MTGSFIIDEVLQEVSSVNITIIFSTKKHAKHSILKHRDMGYKIKWEDKECTSSSPLECLPSTHLTLQINHEILLHSFQILDYVYRDYIHSWYKRISDDQEFHYEMRMTIQRVVVAFSERSVGLLWLKYLWFVCKKKGMLRKAQEHGSQISWQMGPKKW